MEDQHQVQRFILSGTAQLEAIAVRVTEGGVSSAPRLLAWFTVEWHSAVPELGVLGVYIVRVKDYSGPYADTVPKLFLTASTYGWLKENDLRTLSFGCNGDPPQPVTSPGQWAVHGDLEPELVAIKRKRSILIAHEHRHHC
jgi:hypothetical protein